MILWLGWRVMILRRGEYSTGRERTLWMPLNWLAMGSNDDLDADGV